MLSRIKSKLSNFQRRIQCFLPNLQSRITMATAKTKSTVIKSIKSIAPSSATPHHLQTFHLSFLEQRASDTHLNVNFFYPCVADDANGDIHESPGEGDELADEADEDGNGCSTFSRRSELLQNSLSETLKLFYPYAGRFRDDATVNCNDEGVVFMESHANYSLSDILTTPDLSIVDEQLVPNRDPEVTKSFPDSMMFINFVLFTCGGTAILISTTHKIADMTSWTLFFNTWSAASRGIEHPVQPDLHKLATIFPHRDISEKTQQSPAKYNSCMRRFVFRASKVQELKSKLLSEIKREGLENYYPSRVDAVTALIWRCLVTSSKSRTGLFKPSVMFQAVDTRRRMDPPVAQNAVGHSSWLLHMTCEKESELELQELQKKIMGLKVKLEEMGKMFNSKQLDEMINKEREERGEFFIKHKDQVGIYVCSTFCGFGHYEIEFAGMGKPVWVTTVAREQLINFINLKDTKVKGEVEAVIYLSEEEMNAFASDQELLEFAELNPTLL